MSLPLSAYGADRSIVDGLSVRCRECKNSGQRRCNQEKPEQARKRRRRGNRSLRARVFAQYGQKCVCCGEGTPEFLCLDHLNGGGTKHRREVGGGTTFYRWLIRESFPEGYRVLCYNCNAASAYYGRCPHEARHG
jgi:hypothetical protein